MNHQHTLLIYLQQLNPDKNPDSSSKRSPSAGFRGVGNGRRFGPWGFPVVPCSAGRRSFPLLSHAEEAEPPALKICRELLETTASPCKEPSPAQPRWRGKITPQREVLLITLASSEVNKVILGCRGKKCRELLQISLALYFFCML